MNIIGQFKGLFASKDITFFGTFFTRITLLGIGFITSLAIARFFGAATVGQMGLLVGLLVVTSYISLFGAEAVVVKLLSTCKAEDCPKIIGLAVLVSTTLSISVVLVLYRVIQFGGLDNLSNLGGEFALLLPILIIFNSYKVLGLGVLRGFSEISGYNALSLVGASLLFAVVIGIYLGGATAINMPMVLLLVEMCVGFLAIFLILRIRGGWVISFTFSRRELIGYIRQSSIFFLSGSAILVGQIDLVVSGFFLAFEDLGVYTITLRLAALVGLGLVSANVAFSPKLANIFQTLGMDGALKAARGQTQILVPITVVMGGLVIVTGYLILAMFGANFLLGYTALLILVVGQMVAILFGPVGVFLNMTNGQNDMVYVTLTTLGFGIVVSLMLIPSFGLSGAALANASTLILRNGMATFFIYRRTGKSISIISDLRFRR